MEDYRLPVSAVAALKSLRLSGFPEVNFTEGKDTVQLKLTWSKHQPKQIKRADSERCHRLLQVRHLKAPPSAGESTCQPGQSRAKSRKPEPAPSKAKEVSLPKPIIQTTATPSLPLPSPRHAKPPRAPRKRISLTKPLRKKPEPAKPAPETKTTQPTKQKKPPRPSPAATATQWEHIRYAEMPESPAKTWIVDKPKYHDNIDGTRREYVRLYSQSGDPRSTYMLYDQAYSVKGEWYFLGTPGTAEYIKTTTNWEASRYYKGIALLQANEQICDATVYAVITTSEGPVERPIHP